MRSTQILTFAAAVLLPLVLHGQPAAPPLQFASGPAQWLMTDEERRTWRGVKTEAEAQELIDLFWARRDPTPGTFPNEFRAEFNRRVEYADRHFAEGRRRGALTERGRVLIVLGFPNELSEEASKRTAQFSGSASGPDPMDPTGGRALAARDVWNYDHKDASRFGLPKIEVVFIHDGVAGRVRRDTHRNDFITALPVAIASYVKNPDLKAVPEWAKRNELPRVAVEPATAVDGARVSSPALARPEPTASAGEDTRAPNAAPGARRGASKLTLVADSFAVQPQSGSDPFQSLQPVEEFRRDSELGWLFEYCTGNPAQSLEIVEVTLKISGVIGDERVNFNAPPEEFAPDSIKASPGCYLVRGGVPLAEMEPGTYTLMVSTGGYNLTKSFRVIE